MKRNMLGNSDLEVTDLCLGSMTWGTQTPEAGGHAQIDRALDAGINFIDTAEMYPVNPVRDETVGLTEQIIGNWIGRTGRRNDFVLATKMSGAGRASVRGGRGIQPGDLEEALDGSLKRLQTDMIDIYQFHWPNRGSYHFRQNWSYDPSGQNRAQTEDHMVAVLEKLAEMRAKGKIRHFGLSNETAWGTCEWLRLARLTGAPEVISIQNEYSLLCRLYDTDLAELSVNENVGLLAFSPLGAGLLSGKYQNGAIPDGSRRAISEGIGGRWGDRTAVAVDAYLAVARKHDLDPVQMALAWCCTRPFMGSAIFGATTMDQLDHILAGKDLVLSDDVLTDITETHKAHPMPY
ncbi:aldo/keto reductase [Actibacterium sp. 188UL27-1]|uniref:aldo/keto reductase n=1 Tax=Actibacterium sp. 188UL27-1 TaxID=2786961 RepID=UPI00195B92CF|nr:aldo/keto reductase [Actibacterium sp. 188UL27-1]MBM7069230.1 aldo/keto reductase [Actibacterium sp. 188UL27-1]